MKRWSVLAVALAVLVSSSRARADGGEWARLLIPIIGVPVLHERWLPPLRDLSAQFGYAFPGVSIVVRGRDVAINSIDPARARAHTPRVNLADPMIDPLTGDTNTESIARSTRTLDRETLAPLTIVVGSLFAIAASGAIGGAMDDAFARSPDYATAGTLGAVGAGLFAAAAVFYIIGARALRGLHERGVTLLPPLSLSGPARDPR